LPSSQCSSNIYPMIFFYNWCQVLRIMRGMHLQNVSSCLKIVFVLFKFPSGLCMHLCPVIDMANFEAFSGTYNCKPNLPFHEVTDPSALTFSSGR
jgi:hypothetical protein